MAVTVEDGTVVAGANSYRDEAALVAYALARGVTITTGDATPLLIEAMDRLQGLDYIGCRYSRDQPLDWPRCEVCVDGWYYAPNSLPPQLGDAQLALALAAKGTDLQPVATVGDKGAVIEKTIGPLTTRYASPVVRTRASVPVADALLAKILRSGANSFRIIRA